MEPITTGIVVGILISVISGAIIGFINYKWRQKLRSQEDEQNTKKSERRDEKNELKSIKDDIGQLRKYTWRIGKAVVIMAKILDDQSEKNHKESPLLEEIVNEIIKENGDRHEG